MKPVKELSTLYYAQNRKKLLEYQKKYYKENIDKCRAYARIHAQGRIGTYDYNEYAKKYRKKNREKLRLYNVQYQRKRRALMKKAKVNKEAHTSNSKKGQGDWHVNHSSMGMGDYYGTGIRAKLGRMREGVGMQKVTEKQLKTPPRSVV